MMKKSELPFALAACLTLATSLPLQAQISDDDAPPVKAKAAVEPDHAVPHWQGPCIPVKGTKSDRCEARKGRSVEVWFELPGGKPFFGANDALALRWKWDAKRPLKGVVIHNGGYSARMNLDLFSGQAAGAHYTIERDGKIYQHHGEEWAIAHANNASMWALGIELNIACHKIKGKGCVSCNSLDFLDPKKDADKEAIKAACAPTEEQYASLKGLLDDIKARHSLTYDNATLIGHCEADGSTHGDPRAFDWTKVGLSNSEKVERLKTIKNVCAWYDLY
jgi:hypothetical protein